MSKPWFRLRLVEDGEWTRYELTPSMSWRDRVRRIMRRLGR